MSWTPLGPASRFAIRDNMSVPLYMRLLGDSWTQMAEPLRRAHATHGVVRAHGTLRVEHGRYPVARGLARLLGLPRPSPAADTRLTVTAQDGAERWARVINGTELDSRQYATPNFNLAERFGALEFQFQLVPHDGNLIYMQRQAAVVLGPVRVRIPAWCAPRVEAREEPAGPAGVRVEVGVSLPGIGPLIAYAGIIELEEARG